MPKHDKRGAEKHARRPRDRSAVEEILFDKHDGAEELEGGDRDWSEENPAPPHEKFVRGPGGGDD